jgi:hypothetical protein
LQKEKENIMKIQDKQERQLRVMIEQHLKDQILDILSGPSAGTKGNIRPNTGMAKNSKNSQGNKSNPIHRQHRLQPIPKEYKNFSEKRAKSSLPSVFTLSISV